jgi:hypothetical protein
LRNQPFNTAKDRDDWTTGDETMTGAQASYLKTLCDEAGEQFDQSLTKAQASKRYEQRRAEARPIDIAVQQCHVARG